METRTIVFTGHYQQYLDYIKAHKLNPSTYIYCQNPHSLLGIHNVEILLGPDYWHNPAYKNAKKNCRIIEKYFLI